MTKKIPSPIAPDQSLEAESPAVAIIGGGYWGGNMVRNFCNLHSLKLVCDKNETILSSYKDQCEGIETCHALTDVLFDCFAQAEKVMLNRYEGLSIQPFRSHTHLL